MKLHLGALGALTLTLALAGCQQATSTTTSSAFGDTKALTVTATSTVTYYNLSTGAQVTDATAIASNAWDVAFSSATQGIWTNSGDTATGAASGGVGGVYYSGTTTFSDVASYDSSKVAVDTSYTVNTTTQSGTTASVLQLNVLTKLAYNGSGTAADPFSTSTNAAGTGLADADGDGFPDAYQNANIYYLYSNDTHAYTVTNRVYVIKSGDGTKYFKFQVTDMTGSSSSRIRTIKYAVSN